MTEVEICNIALFPIGGTPITSLDEGSKEADLCKALYPAAVTTLLSVHKWNFAKVEVALAVNSSYVMLDERFEFAYQLPADYVRMSRTAIKGTIYERRGQVLTTNADPFVIEYIKEIEDATLFPGLFALAVAARLTVSLAQPLAREGSPSVKDSYSLYQVAFGEAQLEDAQDENPNQADSVGHTDAEDTWLSART